MSSNVAYGAAAVLGIALWMGAAAWTDRIEAWDSAFYWVAAYPAGLVVAAVLGFLAPDRPWRWGLTLMWAQAVALAFAASSFGLLPLGLILFGFLSLPPCGTAALGAAVHRRLSRPSP
jgi:hypothetical protein